MNENCKLMKCLIFEKKKHLAPAFSLILCLYSKQNKKPVKDDTFVLCLNKGMNENCKLVKYIILEKKNFSSSFLSYTMLSTQNKIKKPVNG